MKRLLIVGCGDIATRALPLLAKTFQISALARSGPDVVRLSDLGVQASDADLDQPDTLAAIDFNVDCLLHSVPPPGTGSGDIRTANLIAALACAEKNGIIVPRRIVYLSTTGVYGDCAGAWVDEDRATHPQTLRAQRRVHAEQALQDWTRGCGASLVILRVPGIYAANRLPLERLRARMPVLRAEDDVYSNHIHAEDLGTMIAAALITENAAGIYNAGDDTEMKMGDYFDLVADRQDLPRPPRVARVEAATRVSPEMLSFWSESRRLVSRRIRQDLGIQLRYPTVMEGVPFQARGQ